MGDLLIVGLSDGKQSPQEIVAYVSKMDEKSLTSAQKSILRQVCSPDCMEFLAVILASAIAYNRKQQEHVCEATEGPASRSSEDGEHLLKVAAEPLDESVPFFHSSWPLLVLPDEEWTACEGRNSVSVSATHRVFFTLSILFTAAGVIRVHP